MDSRFISAFKCRGFPASVLKISANRLRLKALHRSELIDLAMPPPAPYMPKRRSLARRLQHLCPLAVLTTPALVRHKRDKARHVSVLPHRNLPLAAPDSAGGCSAPIRRNFTSVFTLPTDACHDVFRTLPPHSLHNFKGAFHAFLPVTF